MGQSCVNPQPGRRKYSFPLDRKKRQQVLLKMIAQDLAARNDQKLILQSTFHCFFHKKGFWGDYIYKEIPGSQNGIDIESFVSTIHKISEMSQKDRIIKLYTFIINEQDHPHDGINYKTLLSILYNYPREDLQKVLNDPIFLNDYFVQTTKMEVQGQIVKRAQSITKRDLNKKDKKNMSAAQLQISSSDSQNSLYYACGHKAFMQEIKLKNKPCQFQGQIQNRRVKLITNNLNSLARKFSRKIFQQYNLDPKTDELKFQHFLKLTLKHHNIYHNYYDGFHEQIWKYTEDHDQRVVPRYLLEKIIIQSQAKWGQQLIHLILVNNTLIVTLQDKHQIPIAIINLDGLTVVQTDRKQKSGILIFHKDNYYPSKTFLFQDKNIRDQWIGKLGCYKGVDITRKYEFKNQIGIGQFSKVYKGINREDNSKCAIKQISNKLSKSSLQSIIKQTQIMTQFDNPILIKHIETIYTKSFTYIITQLVDPAVELNQFLEKLDRPLTQAEAANIARQIIIGTQQIHSKGFIHRDLKPQNILFIQDCKSIQTARIKIIDFGFAISTQQCIYNNTHPNQIRPIVGSIGFLAPQEFISGELGFKADIFSIGGILYYMFTKKLPYAQSDCSIAGYINNAINGQLQFKNEIWGSLSKQLNQLVRKLTQTEPNKRISLRQALLHDWFKNNKPSGQI